MKYIIPILCLLTFGGSAFAKGEADLANGEVLSESCIVCHGQFGQGAAGKLSPRLAGLPKEYLEKAIKDYVHGPRKSSLMVYTSGLDKMTENDIRDVAAYYASLELIKDQRFNIISAYGDAKAGKKVYKRNCDNCHAKDGMGKPKKEAPPLAVQYPEYLYAVMRGFRDRYRVHDNDPEDDSFDDMTDEDYIDIAAYMASLDDKFVEEGYAFKLPTISREKEMEDKNAAIQITNIRQTVVKMELEKGVTPEIAARTMAERAEEIGLKKVAQQRVSRFLKKKGVDGPHLSIYQFCNPMDARDIVMANPVFSAYMPCRVSMVEDADGKMWLMMLNLDMLINSQLLPAKLVEKATTINQQMLDVMAAGARGKALD